MIFVVVFLLHLAITQGVPIQGYYRTATAVIYEEDGLWGSIVFSQFSKSSLVSIEASFKNVAPNNGTAVKYEIRNEPVHYDQYPRDKRCGDDALKEVLSVSGREIGHLTRRNRMAVITGDEFKHSARDSELSLFEDEDNYIVGRSFVVRQGGDESKFACATILAVDRKIMPAGAVPCVEKTYEKCLVGTADDSVCEFRGCSGYERFWGDVDENTKLCRVIQEVFPKPTKGVVRSDGKIGCEHGPHSLLVPM